MNAKPQNAEVQAARESLSRAEAAYVRFSMLTHTRTGAFARAKRDLGFWQLRVAFLEATRN